MQQQPPPLPPPSSYELFCQGHLLRLQHCLDDFWERQRREAADVVITDLPLARIMKIIKADEDVNHVASEALVVFAHACRLFVLEMNDVAVAITRHGSFDFLLDIVPIQRPTLAPPSLPLPPIPPSPLPVTPPPLPLSPAAVAAVSTAADQVSVDLLYPEDVFLQQPNQGSWPEFQQPH
ncbi:unnamed protein product [Spirodela intermedia]|uniref:Transcription factor CBF/NF-Y/archaeal histone domain-containing protein n=1 Tax=Spirodela intermedia TaxID=51605 RepID=A0A7I8J262_SPIIN|nr:unnamed protein product [Spirodela intermedia]CAA6664248.1 unnamed protein product [Spirodela intermedia]